MSPKEEEPFEPLDILGALPEIVENRGRTIVIKYGGNAMVDERISLNVTRDIVFLKLTGMNPVVVHGGGPAISEHMKRVGIDPVFVDGQRRTDEGTFEIVEMVLCGKVNNALVKLINQEGVKAMGLSGKDVGLIEARKYRRKVKRNGRMEEIDLGQVGEVVRVDTEVIELLSRNDIIPVIAPIAVGVDNTDYNINADVLAGEVAAAVSADRLIYLTNVDGILRDGDDAGSLIPLIDAKEAKGLVGNVVTGGMIPKVESSLSALEQGVASAHIINGTTPHTLLKLLLTAEGAGTAIVADPNARKEGHEA